MLYSLIDPLARVLALLVVDVGLGLARQISQAPNVQGKYISHQEGTVKMRLAYFGYCKVEHRGWSHSFRFFRICTIPSILRITILALTPRHSAPLNICEHMKHTKRISQKTSTVKPLKS